MFEDEVNQSGWAYTNSPQNPVEVIVEEQEWTEDDLPEGIMEAINDEG